MNAACYTGVGSRATPPHVMAAMRTVAAALARQGWILRSGGADGADTAFESGCQAGFGRAEIYLPWRGFNGRARGIVAAHPDALTMAAELHPAWSRLSSGARKLHCRNVYQVLGASLDQPSRFLLCWTSDGCIDEASRTPKSGGTATAIVLAARRGVPVYNLAHAGALATWRIALEQGSFDFPAQRNSTTIG